jgi:predicted enzyme related to lactoylglutathione lyase
MIKEFAFVGYPVRDMKKAREFYEGLLGFTPDEGYGKSDNEQFMEYTIGPYTLSLGNMEGWRPSKDGPCVALEVDDVGAVINKLRENNIEVVMEPQEFPVCSMAIVRDPDGNQIVIHKRK